MVKDLHNTQNAKLQQLNQQKESLNQVTNGIKKLNLNTFESLQTKKNKDLIKCIIESSILQKSTPMITIPKLDVFFDTFDQMESLQNLRLQAAIDIKACKLEGKLECRRSKEESFSIKAFSRSGASIPLKTNPFTITTHCSDAKKLLPKIEAFMDNSNVNFKFLASETGEYHIRIHNNELDIEGSPFKVYVYEEGLNQIDLSLPCWYGGTFIQKNQEFWVKGSYTSHQISVFTKRGAKVKTIDLPCDAIFMSSDPEGNLYVGNGLRNFVKLDQNMNVLWTYQHSRKGALPVCSDGKNAYGYSHDSILVLDNETGKLIDTIHLSTHIDEISSLILFQNEFYLSDLFEVKVFNMNGGFQRKYDNESCCLTILDKSIYFCHFNEKNWKKL